MKRAVASSGMRATKREHERTKLAKERPELFDTKTFEKNPGFALKDLLVERGISQTALARHVGVTIQRVNEIVAGKRGISASTAWLLSGALGTTARVWMELQVDYDLAVARLKLKKLPRRMR